MGSLGLDKRLGYPNTSLPCSIYKSTSKPKFSQDTPFEPHAPWFPSCEVGNILIQTLQCWHANSNEVYKCLAQWRCSGKDHRHCHYSWHGCYYPFLVYTLQEWDKSTSSLSLEDTLELASLKPKMWPDYWQIWLRSSEQGGPTRPWVALLSWKLAPQTFSWETEAVAQAKNQTSGLDKVEPF